MVDSVPKKELGKDFNKYVEFNVSASEFGERSDVTFNFRHSSLNFSMILASDANGVIDYSFNGNTVHGTLRAGEDRSSLFFQNRSVTGIWFKVRSGSGGIVYVEGWAPA